MNGKEKPREIKLTPSSDTLSTASNPVPWGVMGPE